MEVRFKFQLGAGCRTPHSQRAGKVTGLMVDRHANPWVSVEYADANGLVVDRWFPEAEVLGPE